MGAVTKRDVPELKRIRARLVADIATLTIDPGREAAEAKLDNLRERVRWLDYMIRSYSPK